MNKRELKELIIENHQVVTNRYDNEIKVIQINQLFDLIDQLDEPENCTEALLELGQTLIRVQEERDKAEKELRELKNSQEEKVVLPDYIDECIRYAGTNIERNKEYVLRSIIEQHYKNDFEEKVYDWFMEKGNLLKFFRAVDNGYTVEEKKYYVKEPTTGQFLIKDNQQSNGVKWVDGFSSNPESYTEKEIKDIAERFWAFAEPVEEEEE